MLIWGFAGFLIVSYGGFRFGILMLFGVWVFGGFFGVWVFGGFSGCGFWGFLVFAAVW